MSGFDPETFMNAQTQGANETDYSPAPEGDWPSYIKDVKARSVTVQGEQRLVLDVFHLVTDERVKEQMGTDEPLVKQGIFVDLDKNGAIAFGKNQNVQLGKLREACKQNDPNTPWAARDLIGQGPLLITVEHDKDGRYANVTKVVAHP